MSLPGGSGAPRRQTGFTLLEILVVVFIIGVILGFATLNLGSRSLDDRAAEEARRLLAIFELARDESDLTGLQLGWLQTEQGYRFVALGDQGWADYSLGAFRPRPLQAPLHLRVEVEDFDVAAAETEQVAPQIIFLSSGELTPFSLELSAPQLDVVYAIRGNLLGQLELQRLDRDELPFS